MYSKNLIFTFSNEFKVETMQFIANSILSLDISFFVAVFGAYFQRNILDANQILFTLSKLLNLTWILAWNRIVFILENSIEQVLFELELIIIESEHELFTKIYFFYVTYTFHSFYVEVAGLIFLKILR